MFLVKTGRQNDKNLFSECKGLVNSVQKQLLKKGTSQYKNVAKLQESLVERKEFDKRT